MDRMFCFSATAVTTKTRKGMGQKRVPKVFLWLFEGFCIQYICDFLGLFACCVSKV